MATPTVLKTGHHVPNIRIKCPAPPFIRQVHRLEKEVKAKTMKYGVAAILLAILITALAYNFGVQPIINQPKPIQMNTFASLEELQAFIKNNMQQASSYSSQFQTFGFPTGTEATQLFPFSASPTGKYSATLNPYSPDYSTTNVQVAGVDEADIVKTDGTYLYVVSGSNVTILKAYPPNEAQTVSKITLNETYSLQIYVSADADKLAIIGSRAPHTMLLMDRLGPATAIYPSYYNMPEASFIKVYDIADPTDPVLTRDLTVNGTLGGSRMIGNYIYLATAQSAISPTSNLTNVQVVLPEITENNATTVIQPTEIRYASVTDIAYSFTTIIAINITDDAQAPTHETFLAGSSSRMYVSLENMYLAIPDTNWIVMPMLTTETTEETIIYRIKLDQDKVNFEAKGSVPGFVIDQFSMDEYNGYFRIATTTGWGNDTRNGIYVLNMTLGVVGKLPILDLEDPRERITSARFIGDRAYLVTFLQRDPFYVIDLTDPTQPKVLGFLKIPGFSGYLHPYDDDHIIGVGSENGKVKLSLYDVTNVTAPIELAKYIVPGDYSYSTAVNDHKAFLFDKAKQLLAIPVSTTTYTWVNGTYGQSWQGEYVFNLDLTSGFTLRGSITHQDSSSQQYDSGYWIKRALYIDNVLYTISDKMVKMNSLTDLSLLKEVTLP